MGNFTNWVGYTGTYTSCCPTQGIVNGRHTIMTGGTDPKTNNLLNVLPPGATRSARLGNSNVNYEAERLRYTLTVTPQNSLFIYKYAVVLEDPGHSASDQPKFNIRVLNSSGNLIDPVCGFYSVVSSGSIPGFQSAPGSVRWKNWTTVGLNLTPYMGQTITIEYTTYDCNQGAHFGYAYLACSCEPMQINVNFCAGSSTVVLTAPSGFTYLWSPGGATTQSITLQNPTIGATYNCTLTSANGCQVVLQAVLQPTIVTSSFNVTSPLCSNTKTFQSTSTVNQGSIATYQWNFGNGATSTQQNPTYTYPNPGTYTVTLTVTSSMGGCVSSSSQQVLVYPPPTANAGPDKNICTGQSTSLTASGGASYLWSNGGNTATITVSPAVNTTYTVTVTDGNGCTASDNAIVSMNPAPLASAGPNKSICIGASTTLNGSGGATYSWAPALNLNNSAIATPTANPTVTTTYTVTVTSTNGCTATSSMVLTVNPPPNASAGFNSAICIGGSTTLNATGGVSYLWAPTTGLSNPSISNPVASPTATTTYTVTVTDANGCTASSSKVVTVNNTPTPNAGPDAAICINASSNLIASGGTTYVWAPATGLSNPNISNPVATPTATTTYTVTVSNAANCSATDNMVLTVNPLPNASAGPNKSICVGNSTTLDGSGGTTYVWSPSTSLSNNAIANPVANPTVTTTYTVTVTNSNGCSNTSSMVLTVNPLPQPSAGANTTICNGHSANLQASGGTVYIWQPASSLNNANIYNPVASPAATTTYTVTVTNSNGCSATSSTIVNVNNLPPANAGTDQIICLNQSANFTATGGVQYQWSNGSNTQSINVSPQVNTTYIVTVTDINGCSATDDANVSINALPPADAGINQAICIGNTTNLNASGGVAYLWSPATDLSNNQIANPIASPTVTTTYTVTVTDVNGCSASDNMVLTINPLPLATAGNNLTICLGNTATLNAMGGISYVWSPAATLSNANISNPVANPTVTTTYTVTVTDANTCSATSNMILTVNNLPVANAGNDDAICIYESTVLNANGGSNYLWSPATGLNNSNISNPVASPTVTTTYTVTVSDANNCSATDDMVLTVYPLPQANAGNDMAICYGDSTTLNASGGVLYTWSPNNNITNTAIHNPVVFPTINTTYTVVVTDINGCKKSDDVVINILSLPPADAGINQAICEGENAQLSASGGITYLWNTGDNTANISVSPPSSIDYIVTVTDNNGCSASDAVTVTVNYPPPAHAGNGFSICTGETAQLSATGGVQYVWSPAAGLSNAYIYNPVASPSVQTTYTVTVTDIHGCSATDDVVLSIFPSPVIAFVVDKYNGCEPLLVHFSDSTPQSIQSWYWDFGDPGSGAMNNSVQQNPLHLYQYAGTYSVSLTVITTDGCQKTLVYNNLITVYPTPIASFTPVPPYGSIEYPYITFNDGSINAYTWFWNFGDPTSNNNFSTLQNPTHKYSGEGNFVVILTVQSEYGCVDSVSGIIRILPGFSIYIPNAFTPNGDGVNDFFNASGTNISEYTMYIFDRWGEMMFESHSLSDGWSGRSARNDEPLMQDVYVYKIIAKDHLGKTYQYIGHVTLLVPR